jgi:(p)ppGpp synthase/HD superfamily hydrolase
MKDNRNIWDRDKYLRAWHFASIHHTGQNYGGHNQDQYVDYLTHIGMVSMEVIWALQNSKDEYNANLAVQCAILHDTIEDTEINYQDLLNEFGKEVAAGVLALTKNKEVGTKELQMQDSLNRIKLQGPEIWMVKMADRISNLDGAPFYWDKQKIIKYRNEAQIIYDSLSKANNILAFRLKNRIDDYFERNNSK